ncbi:MAG: tetratricopeptide repeat protein [Saprospiraceae bacterium]|nr:tetratricopeptide repeat protein [Saprospiraceae bacterium]
MAVRVLFFSIFFLISFFSSSAQKTDAKKEYNSGMQYYNLHNYKSAIPFFEAAIRKDNSFVYAYRVLISCYEMEGDLLKAAELYEQVIELSPSDKQICYNLALTYIELQEFSKSIIYLKKSLKIDPTYVKATNKLKEVETYIEKHNREKIGKQYTRVVEVEDKSTENNIYNAALHEYREQSFSNCLSKLNSYQGEVHNPNFYYLRAISLQHLGERKNAIEAYENTLELDDRHFNANLNLGKMYYNDHNYEEAVHLLETAYLQRKNDMKLLYSLAKAHYYYKEYQEAIVYFNLFLERNSNEGEAWSLLGESYSKIGKSKNAAKAFEEAKKHGTNNDHISDHIENNIARYGKKASEYTKTGNFQQAILILEKGIEEHSEAASLHFNLGLNYLEIGNSKKAREEFKKTIDLEPAHAKAYQGLALLYYERQEFKDAAAYYLATIDAGKHDEYVYYKLGSCYYKLNRFEAASEAYQQAVKLNPGDKHYHFALALAYLALDKNYQSITSLETAVKLDPMFLDAHYHICVNLIKTSQYEKCIIEAEKILQKNNLYAKAFLVIGHAYKRMGNYLKADEYQKKAVRIDPSLKQ